MKKTTKIIILFIFCFANILISCKKDKAEKILLPQSFSNTNNTIIIDKKTDTLYSIIEVPIIAKIKDTTKVTIEVELEHTFAGDLTVELILPTGASLGVLLGRVGGGYNFAAGQFLKFTAGNKVSIQNAEIISDYIAGGNFAPSKSDSYSATIPLANLNNLLGVPVKGSWKIKILDSMAGDNGKLLSWKITFAEGAF